MSYFMGCIALVRCVLVLRCCLAGVVWYPDASFSLQHGQDPFAPNLQHITNREQNDRCGNSTAQSQAPHDGHIIVRNMLST